MAAPKENLLSLGHLTGAGRDSFIKQREHKLRNSVNRHVMLQTDFSTPQSHQQLRAMHLHQHWQELKERELAAQKHNRQLLQQFEEAQKTLREMITLNAAMKTIRIEYDRYLEDSIPRWHQQLKEKTQAAQKKRMEDYLRSCLKNTDERVTKSADRPSLSQGATTKPQKMAAPPKQYNQNNHLDYNQDVSPHLPYMQPSWQTHPQSQTARFPVRAPYQPQGSSHGPPSFLPPSIFPHPHSFHHFTSTPAHHHHGPRLNPPGWASQQSDYPWSWAAGAAGVPSGSEALWGLLHTEEPPPEMRVAQVVEEEAETSTAPSSKRERGVGSRSSHLSQELDIKPVRLSGGHAESGESSRDSSRVSSEKRKRKEKRRSSRCFSSDRESCSSKESSQTFSAIVIVAVAAAQSSESDDSSVKSKNSSSRRTRRSGGLAVGSPRAESVAEESKGDKSGSQKEESQSTSEDLGSPIEESKGEKVGDRSPDDKSESCEESESQREEESGSVSVKIENGEKLEKQESSRSEQSSVGGKDEEEECEKKLGDKDDDVEGKEKSQTDEEPEEGDLEEDDEASEEKNTTEEEEDEAEDEAEEQKSEEKSDHEEESDRLNNEDGENGQKGSSQDEEVGEDKSEGGEDSMEEEGESDEGEEDAGEEEEEQKGDKAALEEEGDSEDSIILPQSRSKKMLVIPEEASEEDEEEEEEEEEEAEGGKMGSSDGDSNEFSDEDDDVENLLAPREQSQKKDEKDVGADEKTKAICDNVMTFQAKPDKSNRSDQAGDSDEFDDFYS